MKATGDVVGHQFMNFFLILLTGLKNEGKAILLVSNGQVLHGPIHFSNSGPSFQ